MRILFLTRSFNGLTQRLYLELAARGHELSVEFDIADSVTEEAVALFRPALVIAPFLRRAIPESVWRRVPCLVVHPGVVGDRGPSALDWAIMAGEREWGVTVLQAIAELDAGPVWASESFAMRPAPKSSLYRREVTDAAVRAVLAALRRFEAGSGPLLPAPSPGRWRPLMTQAQRRIDWQRDDTATVLRKIRAADGAPGVLDALLGVPCHLFDAHPESLPPSSHAPGDVIARRDDALLRTTVDGAVWIGQVRRADVERGIKLPAVLAFADEARALPEWSLPIDAPPEAGWREIRHEVVDGVGYLHFDLHNGAMSARQCERLADALRIALGGPERVLVLMGGQEFWSNGIHLNVIEAADSPADESWRNIAAIDDVTRVLIEATDTLVIAALHGNAGAGGAFMALAADRIWAHDAVVLNPHYKNMGNLYGSEYWTYLLPRRLSPERAAAVVKSRLPLAATEALRLGLVDDAFGADRADFTVQVRARARALAEGPEIGDLIAAKRRRRRDDEAIRPLAAYRADELVQMQRNFYGFDTSYHVARSNFVHHVAPSWTPRHLCVHRRIAHQRKELR